MKRFFLAIFFLTITVIFPHRAWATSFDLIAPSGQLTRGQDVQFTINIDTENANINTVQVGMTFETQYVQYVSTTPGNAMSQVAVETQSEGRLLLTGTNGSGFSGQGTFAYVTFKIIAQAPGSTQLCALWAPSPTNQPQPTSIPGQPTVPLPTALPRTGNVNKANFAGIAGFIFVIGALGLYFFSKDKVENKKSSKKSKHH